MRKILAESSKIVNTYISKSDNLCDLIMDLSVLTESINNFYVEQNEKTKVMIFLTHLKHSVRSLGDEVVKDMELGGHYDLQDFGERILELIFPNFSVVLEREFRDLKQEKLSLNEYSRRHKLFVQRLGRPLDTYKLKFIEGLYDRGLKTDLAKSNYTRMSHDEVCSLASSQLHSRPERQLQQNIGLAGTDFEGVQDYVGLGAGGTNGGWQHDMSNWETADYIHLALDTVGEGPEVITEESQWANMGDLGKMLRNIDFPRGRCAQCFQTTNHKASKCNSPCYFCKRTWKSCRHYSIGCDRAPTSGPPWKKILMDIKNTGETFQRWQASRGGGRGGRTETRGRGGNFKGKQTGAMTVSEAVSGDLTLEDWIKLYQEEQSQE